MKTNSYKYVKYIIIYVVFLSVGEITLYAQSDIFVGSSLYTNHFNSVNALKTFCFKNVDRSSDRSSAKVNEDLKKQEFVVQNYVQRIRHDTVDTTVIKSSKAVPAYPYPIEVKQPDGQILIIRIHGDEHSHFITTEDGYLLVQNIKGYYVYGNKNKSGKVFPTKIVSHNQNKRTISEIRYLKKYKKKVSDINS